MPLTLDFIARSTGGSLVGTSAPTRTDTACINSVAIDSRAVGNGALFACLPGEKTDGHDFADEAVKRGCSAILAARNPFDTAAPSVPVVLVPDVAAALRNLAFDRRDAFAGTGGKVVALTGTAGKTTVKETLFRVLRLAGPVSCTPGNLNNGLGVPLSILNARDDALRWVIEAGISHAGDMEELGSLIRPDLAIVLNAGPGHTEGLGGRGTAYHKAQLLRFLAPGGKALVNADYPDLVREALAVRRDIILFSGNGRGTGYGAAYVRPLGDGRGLYRLWLEGDPVDVDVPFVGAFAAENLIAVAAASLVLGINPKTIAKGLQDAAQPPQRFRRYEEGGWTIVDDSYNANPLSMARMLSAVSDVAEGKPIFCMLGAMGELGSVADEEHRRLGRILAEMRPKAVCWTGSHLGQVRDGLSSDGADIPLVDAWTPERFMAFMAPFLGKGGLVFFKGSRSNRLERYVEAFVDAVRTKNAL